MAALKKAKWEVIAQGLAEGKTQGEAYQAAGFKTKSPDRVCSALLANHPEIQQRVIELRNAAQERAERAINKASHIAAMSKSYVLTTLHEITERCMQHRPVLNANGEQVYVETPDGKIAPAYTFDAKGARGAVHLIGLEMGMFVQRVRLEKTPFDDLPAPVLRAIMENLIAMRQGRIIDQTNARALPAPGSGVDSEPSS